MNKKMNKKIWEKCEGKDDEDIEVKKIDEIERKKGLERCKNRSYSKSEGGKEKWWRNEESEKRRIEKWRKEDRIEGKKSIERKIEKRMIKRKKILGRRRRIDEEMILKKRGIDKDW